MKNKENKQDAIKTLVNSEFFQYIEEDFMDRISRLKNVDEIDSTGSPETVQLQVMARKEASKMLLKVLEEWKASAKHKDGGSVNPFERSMR
jgi:hypothetical protein